MKKTLRIACLAAMGLASHAALGQDLPSGYTCCNFHYEKDWISDANWRYLPMIPAGAKIKVLDYGSNRASVEIDGKPMRIGHDYGRREQKLQEYIEKLVVKNDPRARIAKYPEKVREAIRQGKVITGMTREQVIISAGYPPTHRTPRLDASVWNMWASRTGRYEVHFNGKGTVEKLVGYQ
ncbi:MAG TPA: hypothetical protein VM051_10450 [Usitatibacter sp.]|nr:hypothetical protein [Usitatibacter sp.]